jgi:hypothetical protein
MDTAPDAPFKDEADHRKFYSLRGATLFASGSIKALRAEKVSQRAVRFDRKRGCPKARSLVVN